MSDSDSSGFGKFVPGFEFMQNLARQAAGGLTQGVQQSVPQLPNLGNWVAPTFNVEDLEKRIEELKAVHFWLDQNSRALAATIQALEVQKMTLATLQGMNFSMGDVANALKIKAADTMAGMAGLAGFGAKAAASGATSAPSFASASPPAAPTQFAGLEIPPPRKAAPEADPEPVPAAAPAAAVADKSETITGGVVDPMQWWGALTQQFQAIATNAMKDAASQAAVDASKNMASTLTREAVKTATEMTTGLARGLVGKSLVSSPNTEAPSSGGLKAQVAETARKAVTQVGASAVKTVAKAAVPKAAKVATKAEPKTSSRAGVKTAGKTPSKAASAAASKTGAPRSTRRTG